MLTLCGNESAISLKYEDEIFHPFVEFDQADRLEQPPLPGPPVVRGWWDREVMVDPQRLRRIVRVGAAPLNDQGQSLAAGVAFHVFQPDTPSLGFPVGQFLDQ